MTASDDMPDEVWVAKGKYGLLIYKTPATRSGSYHPDRKRYVPADKPSTGEAAGYTMKAALESIAKNTCCDKCQEAALVAREALQSPEAYQTSRKVMDAVMAVNNDVKCLFGNADFSASGENKTYHIYEKQYRELLEKIKERALSRSSAGGG